MINSWQCLQIDSSTTNCTVTSSSTMEVATSTVPYGDWLIMNSLILFMVAFVPISILFSTLRKSR